MSVSTGKPVADDLGRVFPATLEMATLGIIIGVLLGVPMGVYRRQPPGHLVDQVIRVVGLLGYSVPAFWLGLVGLARLLRPAQMGRRARPHRHLLRRAGAAGHRAAARRQPDRRRSRHLLQRRLPPDAAGVDPRLLQPRLHRAHDALVHARPARPGISSPPRGSRACRSGWCSGGTPSGRSACR